MADCHSRDPSYDFEADMKSLELLNVGEMVKLLWPGFVFPLWGWRDSISGNMRKELSLQREITHMSGTLGCTAMCQGLHFKFNGPE